MSNIQDMNNRIKQNREQRPSKRSKFKENNREGIYSTEKTTESPNFKSVPEKELNEIKKQIIESATAKRKKERIVYVIAFIFCVIALIGILVLLN